jgi:hypothetical protein
MNKIALASVAMGLAVALGLTTLHAQQRGLVGASTEVRTNLAFYPIADPIGAAMKSTMRKKLSRSKVIALLPDSPDSGLTARFSIDIQTRAIGPTGDSCGELAMANADRATATAVSYIYHTYCTPGRGGSEAGSGLIICSKDNLEKCVDTIVRAAENNASVTDQLCRR